MPKIVDYEQRRIAIVTAARQLIVEGGFEAATMRRIADRAGFSNGALKPYFATKHDIMLAAIDGMIGDFRSQTGNFAVMFEGLPAERLNALIRLPIAHSADEINNGRFFLVLWNEGLNNEEVGKRYRAILDLWLSELAKAIAAVRETQNIDAHGSDHDLALEGVSMAIGSIVVNLHHRGGEYVDDYLRYADGFVERVTGAPVTV